MDISNNLNKSDNNIINNTNNITVILFYSDMEKKILDIQKKNFDEFITNSPKELQSLRNEINEIKDSQKLLLLGNFYQNIKVIASNTNVHDYHKLLAHIIMERIFTIKNTNLDLYFNEAVLVIQKLSIDDMNYLVYLLLLMLVSPIIPYDKFKTYYHCVRNFKIDEQHKVHLHHIGCIESHMLTSYPHYLTDLYDKYKQEEDINTVKLQVELDNQQKKLSRLTRIGLIIAYSRYLMISDNNTIDNFYTLFEIQDK